MAGNANPKIRSPGGAAPLDYRFERQGFFTEVNSRRSRGQRNVQPVIDEDTRGSRPRFGSGETREFY